TVLWRVVVMHRDGSYYEGFYSLFDAGRPLRLVRFEGTPQLRDSLGRIEAVQRLASFTHGFYKVQARDGKAWVTDLRMGQEPHYTFRFLVAQREGEGAAWTSVVPQLQGSRGDTRRMLAWLWDRLRGNDVAP